MIEFYRSSKLLEVPGVVHGFTTRDGGESTGPYRSLNLSLTVDDDRDMVRRNRALVLNELGRSDARWVSLRQEHGPEVVQVTASAGGSIAADGLWTRDRNAAVAVLVADCVPVLFADRSGRTVGAVHAGWRGTRSKIVQVMCKRWRQAGIDLSEVVVAIGPAIGPECFEVGPEVADELHAAFPEATDAFRNARDDRIHVDLWRLNELALIEAGISENSIQTLRLCTSRRPELFSHRGDGGTTGRQAGVISFSP